MPAGRFGCMIDYENGVPPADNLAYLNIAAIQAEIIRNDQTGIIPAILRFCYLRVVPGNPEDDRIVTSNRLAPAQLFSLSIV